MQKQNNSSEIINIASRLELFIDHFLIDTLINASLKLHYPIDRGNILNFDNPWEGQFSGYSTIIKNDEKYQLYYRGINKVGNDGQPDERTCYAESYDGINWIKPNLGIYKIDGSFDNNVILANEAPATHNFSPFLDSKKDVPEAEKYKALGGTKKSGLIAFISSDGINWRKLQDSAVFKDGEFDSQNVSFWSEVEQQYVCYFRSWIETTNGRFRSISKTTSKDFRNWTDPIEMEFGNSPREHLYTNQTSPYFRAPHILVSIAARFMPGRQVLTSHEAERLNVNPKYFKDCSDAILMTSRGGNLYDRTFLEAFIRPGIGLENWVSRSNYPTLNVVQTNSKEMSIYVNQNYAQPSAHLRRYSLRIDGFSSVHADYKVGELITKPFLFNGNNLVLNFSTSAAGFVKIEIQDKNGIPINGFEEINSIEIIGNEISKTVAWKNYSDLNELNGIPIKLKFTLSDADIFSIKFE
ncbi:MAG: hypothetical protein KDC88_13025 [Ignavibacteriae bacterium]|nr:hypothetical protein [Ignavibacteriota bacterium]